MTVIQVKGLIKTYQRPVKEPGFRGSAKGIFHRSHTACEALKSFDLTVDKGFELFD